MRALKIVRKTKSSSLTTVHDIAVQDAHHYILENGVVSHNSYVPQQILSGGGGIQYASDSIVFLSKSKDKEGTEVVGNIMKGRMFKSRLSRENKVAEMRLSYDTGLDRYFGLLEMAEEAGMVKRVGNRYEFPNGEKYFRKNIDEDPAAVYTTEFLNDLDKAVQRKFKYGQGEKPPVDPDIED